MLACGTPSQPQDTGSPEVDADGLIVTIPINTPVPRGACTVSWRLADAAGETIVGDFTTFRVDARSRSADHAGAHRRRRRARPRPAPSSRSRPAQSTSSDVDSPNEGSNGGALWLGRLLSTIGILALFGGLALIAIGWPEGPEYVVTVRYLRAVWILALIGTFLYLIAYAAKFNDTSFGAAINPSAWLDLKDDGWPGRGALLRLAFVLGSGWVAMRPERIIDPATAMWAWAIPGGALISVALSRVEGPAPWLGVGDRPDPRVRRRDLVRRRGARRPCRAGRDRARRTCCTRPGRSAGYRPRRWSLVVLTGVAQMIRLDGNPFTSSHGQVVLLKAVAVAAMIAVGLEARRQVGYRLDRAHEMTVPLADRFRRAFGAEAAIGVVVLAFSGWLLSLTPAKVDPLADEAYAAGARVRRPVDRHQRPRLHRARRGSG